MRSCRFFLPVILALTFFPYVAFAQVDQRCFTRNDCIQIRKEFAIDKTNSADLASGFVTDDPQIAAACGGTKNAAGAEVGFCLPAGQSKTTIKFGGQDTFANLGEFIKFAYRYLTWAAGLIAVAMIVVSGVQWAASGGSPDIIGDAKKRIGGAITGLILLALSYVILYTINPYLLQLRLPQIWMINTQGLVPPLCSEVSNKKLQDAGEKGTVLNLEEIKEKAKKEYNVEPQTASCGHQFLVEGSGSQMCTGTACEKGHVCYAYATSPDKKESCKGPDLNVAGVISNSSIIGDMIAKDDTWLVKAFGDTLLDFWAWPWVPERTVEGTPITIELVCNQSGKTIPLDTEYNLQDRNEKEHTMGYQAWTSEQKINEAIAKCPDPANIKGFVVEFDFNYPNSLLNEGHFIGRGPDGKGVDLIDTYSGTAIFSKVVNGVPAKYFISKDDLIQGVRLDVDAGHVCIVGNSNQKRAACYGEFGFNN